MAITKAELVSIVSENCSFSRQESVQIVDQVFQILKETLEKGEKVKISGFGNFITREKRARKGRNPQTGHEMMISGRRVLTFKPSAILRKAVNQGG
jgi:integration host factor subunit alpha